MAPTPPGPPAPFDAVVLAGGAARRLGGVDKPALPLGGATLLERVLASCRHAARRVVVGPRRPLAGPGADAVVWTRETPPGGGPLPALAAGLAHVREETVVVLAADLPFMDEPTVRRLLAARADDGALLTDAAGRAQPLAAVYRTASLRRELAALSAGRPALTGLPLRLLTSRLALRSLPDDHGTSFDCDTWEDVTTARARIGEHESVLETWIAEVKSELGIEDLEVDTAFLLDVARDAAHGVARPAAPLTTFLVGYAAGRAGADPHAVAEAARKAQALALSWERRTRETEAGGRPGEPEPTP
ncbi:NTP transferase domain-containing protein [Streptomyces capparidis]